MYKNNYFIKEQMTKFKVLPDADKAWDKMLTHFTNLYALCKAYGNDRAAKSGFESAAHVRNMSTSRSVVTTESNITPNLYLESLEESLAAVREYAAKEPPPPTTTTNQVELL